MKKLALQFLCYLAVGTLGATTYTSRSIMNIAAQAPVDPTLYDLFTNQFIYDRQEPRKKHTFAQSLHHLHNKHKSRLNVVVWGGSTTNADNIAQYLLPFGQTELLVREGYANVLHPTNPNVDVPGNQSIVAENFNITTAQKNFCSTLTFKPKQTVVGVNFFGYCQLTNKLWVSFEAPFVHMKNTVDMVETVTFNGGFAIPQGAAPTSQGFNNTHFFSNMQQAFKADGMLYGKIDGTQTKNTFAEVKLKAGYTYLHDGRQTLQMYGGIILPTGNKPKSKYLFEPLVGNNKHWGVVVGSYFTRNLETQKFTLNLSMDSAIQYLFKNTQMRSFDLAGKPWSRYLGIYADNSQRLKDAANGTTETQMRFQTWGINYFTQAVTVKPYYLIDFLFNASFVLPHNSALDFGLKVFSQSGEEVELKNPWQLGPMIGKLSDGVTSFLGECAPLRGINNMYSTVVDNSTTNAIYITQDQLDMTSASQPFRTDYTFYAALHTKLDSQKIKNCILQSGFGYTIASNNATANRWQLWIGGARNF